MALCFRPHFGWAEFDNSNSSPIEELVEVGTSLIIAGWGIKDIGVAGGTGGIDLRSYLEACTEVNPLEGIAVAERRVDLVGAVVYLADFSCTAYFR